MRPHLKPKLILKLALQDLQYRHHGSVLSYGWHVIQPALTIAVLWFAVVYGFRSQTSASHSTLSWILTGFIPWIFFSEALVQGTNSVLEKSYLLKKVNFPFLDLPLVKLTSALGIHLIFTILLVIYLQFTEAHSRLDLRLFYFVFCNFIFALSVSRLTSLIQVVFRDLLNIVQFGVTILFWVSPVFWNPSRFTGGEPLAGFIKYNPLNFIISGYRSSLLADAGNYLVPSQHYFFWVLVFIFLGLGQVLQRYLAQEITDYL